MDTSETYAKMCNCPEIQGKWAILMDVNPRPATDVHDYSTYIISENRGLECVWLPRQDQIQDMIGCVAGNHVNIMEQFVKADYFLTLEQKWLAFYMKENHNKVWDGKEWESGK